MVHNPGLYTESVFFIIKVTYVSREIKREITLKDKSNKHSFRETGKFRKVVTPTKKQPQFHHPKIPLLTSKCF